MHRHLVNLLRLLCLHGGRRGTFSHRLVGVVARGRRRLRDTAGKLSVIGAALQTAVKAASTTHAPPSDQCHAVLIDKSGLVASVVRGLLPLRPILLTLTQVAGRGRREARQEASTDVRLRLRPWCPSAPLLQGTRPSRRVGPASGAPGRAKRLPDEMGRMNFLIGDIQARPARQYPETRFAQCEATAANALPSTAAVSERTPIQVNAEQGRNHFGFCPRPRPWS